MENGSVYFGKIKQGKRHDQSAIMLFEDLSLVYRGGFADDLRDGKAVITSDVQDDLANLRVPCNIKQHPEDQYLFEGSFQKDEVAEEVKAYAKGRFMNKIN